LYAIVIILLLLVSSIAIYSTLTWLQPSKATALPESLLTSINPSGPIQLTSNQDQIFTANTSDATFTKTYDWSITNPINIQYANTTNYLLLTNENQAYFKFLDNSSELCWLNVEANAGTVKGNATVTIQCLNYQANNPQEEVGVDNTQQATINNSTTASYIVTPTETGEYQVVNGSLGMTIPALTSEDANITLNKAMALGGIINIKAGNYSGAQLIVPSNVRIIADPTVTGIKYASVANGARIDEPNFNQAFRGYSQNDYTIVANRTSTASNQPWYLAFKPDQSIYWQSTNASYVLLSVLGAIDNANSITIMDPLTLDTTITLDKSVEIEFANFGDTNNPNIIFSGTGNVITINPPQLIAKHAAIEITLRNLRIDGQGHGENGIEISGTVTLYAYDLKISNMGGIGFYSHAWSTFLRGTTITVSTNNKEGFYMNMGQIDVDLIFAVGNGGSNYSNAVFQDVGPGSIGRLVASGGAGKTSSYGAYFISGNFGLTIGTLHLENDAEQPLIIGENETVCGLQNSVIESIFLYNSSTTPYAGYPIVINNASSLNIGSVNERNANSTSYLYDYSMVILNVKSVVINSLDVQKEIFRGTYANDGQVRILLGYKTEYP
jgi:hypothetical protein